jgi:hypothetical protein
MGRMETKMSNDKSVSGFIEALSILSQYMKEGPKTSYFLGAEHDILYVYTEAGLPLPSTDEGRRLQDLGFHVDNDVEGWAYYT